MKKIYFKCPSCNKVYLPSEIQFFINFGSHTLAAALGFIAGIFLGGNMYA